ncbi:type VII secretion-associated serine protease mycosin [Nocardia sp. NPDC004278]
MRFARIGCAAAVLVVAMLGVPGPAGAVPLPGVDPGAIGLALALSQNPAPLEPTEQKVQCAEPVLKGVPPREPPVAQRVLNLPEAWQFSRGAGQRVAVIDTGVNRHPRLPGLQAGGDFVSTTDGTEDCDGHGTIVAGIIGAQPSPGDAFVGVAPDAQVLTIRQLSLAYQVKNSAVGNQVPGAITGTGYGNVLTLAAAIVRATDMGATVINISEVACTPAGADTADGALGAAVKYAFDHNVVVVAAAGNLQQDGACQVQNSGSGWSDVQTISSPAWFDKYVLSVASIDPTGATSELTLRGPWIGVAAIGRQITSLDSKRGGTGLIDAVQTREGPHDIEGTSFAAPYVSGLAALVRARFPELNAAQVIDRIERTAHGPGTGRDDGVGHGLIDLVAALTAQLPAQPVNPAATVRHDIPAPYVPPAPDPRPRRWAIIGSTASVAVLGIGALVAIPFRRRHSDHEIDQSLLDSER